MLEEFFVKRRLGIADSMETPAKHVDAFLVLRDELDREDRDGTSEH